MNNILYIDFMPSLKDEVIEVISKLPDDVKMQDIKSELEILEKILRGLDDIENGRYKSIHQKIQKILENDIKTTFNITRQTKGF